MTNKKPIWTKSFINISISTFFVFAVFYSLLTFVPLYVLNEMDGTAAQAGLATTVFLVSAIIMRFFAGMILEKYGKKKILVLAAFFFTISTVLYPLTSSFGLLLALRFFHGVWFSLLTTVAGAIVADLVPPERRGEGLGYYGMSMNLAMVGGPFLALTLQPLVSARTIFLVFGAIMVIGFFCALAVRVAERPIEQKEKRKLGLEDFVEKRSVPVSSVGLLISFAYSSIITFISVYAASLGLIQAASFFFVVFAIAMLIVRPFTGRMFDMRGPNIVIIPSIALFGLGLIALSFTESAWMLLVSGALVGLGYGTLLPCFQTLAIQAADSRRSAYATGTFFALYDGGIAIGSIALGVFAGILGYSNLYLALGIFLFAVILYYRWIMKRKHVTAPL